MKSKIPSIYSKMAGNRSSYLTSGQEYSEFTLPYVLPVTSNRTGGGANQHGWTSIGAQAVNHLSNKLTVSLFPPQRSFFKVEIAESSKAEVEEAGFSKEQFDTSMVELERQSLIFMENINSRTAIAEAFRHLLIAGNALLVVPEEGNMVTIALDHYVVRRDSTGFLLELIILQEKDFESLSKEEQIMVKAADPARYADSSKKRDKVKLYTRALYKDGLYHVTQSADEVTIGKLNTYTPNKLPWIPLRWNTAYSEDYGRGLVEDHAGDFYVVNSLSESLVRGSILMADIKYILKMGSIIDLDRLVGSESGEVLYGNPDDVTVMQVDKSADLSFVSGVLEEYKGRIGRAFMMGSANRRDAERVTAAEVRLDANELETSMGGVYSQLSQTLQKPLAHLLIQRTDSSLTDTDINPTILTGIEALGRVGDLDKIVQFSELMSLPNNWAEPMQQKVDVDKFAAAVANALSMELTWLKDKATLLAEQKANQAAMQQQEMESGLAAEASKAAPDLIKENM